MTTPKGHNHAMTEAQQAEATGTPIEIEFNEHTYVVDVDEVTIDAYEAFREDDGYGWVKGVLGDEQFTEYKKRNPRLGTLRDMSRAIVDAMGNSQASTDS